MGYIGIVNLIYDILYILTGVIVLHYIVFALIGLFKKKRYPKAEEQLRYGLIIPARNEETVVGNLIKSIQKNNYPQDKLQIFVMAHNCTDRTAEIARELGATVYEYTNPNECTMGYAFKYLFDQINKDYGCTSFDGFILFNADNILDENYLEKMNDAFVAHGKRDVITSFRNSKNFGENVMSACYGLYFVYGCLFESRGRSICGCSTRVQGTGYVINSELVKDGWKYVTLTEDWEFTADQLIEENNIYFCDEAVFYDEQPTDFKVMWRQRVRWCRGRWLVCVSRLKDLLKSLFKPKSKNGNKNKFSLYDMTVKVLPVCIVTTVLYISRLITVCLAPAFFPLEYTLPQVLVGWLVRSLIFFGISYVILVLSSTIIYIAERKRIKNVSLRVKILSTLVWPFFLLIATPAEFVAIFSKNLGWKEIPHKNTTSFEDLNK
ncbi:MAG: glycosyltransferase family 2 protein [Clostridia bacterium]|nr:glycosyltransferase family 2 protein [Clostridia bacterium]